MYAVSTGSSSKRGVGSSHVKKRTTVNSIKGEGVDLNPSGEGDEDGGDALKKQAQPFGAKRALLARLEPWVSTLVYTLIAAYFRLYRIGWSKSVVWDEAHFARFGSYYMNHTFYHDVHPPLGKMLIALSEWIAGFHDPEFAFKSGSKYPEEVDFVTMRVFNALFSIAVIPPAYWTARWLSYRPLTVHLITLMVALESSFITLGKFVLLDSILLFFTATTFMSLAKIMQLKRRNLEFSKEWYTWMVISGISIGCVCSVKWVGLFVTVLYGLFVIQDLAEKLFDKGISWKKYSKHWLVRITTLVFIPFVIYAVCFKIHFSILYKTGKGDSSASSLFQAQLEGTKISSSPRDVVFGSEVTIRSKGLSTKLLHSHTKKYPSGSLQKQVTTYGFFDANNNWIFKFARRDGRTLNNSTDHIPVRDGDAVRLVHKATGANLHSHEIPAHVSYQHYEVSCYGDDKIRDLKDDWIVEIVSQAFPKNQSYANEDRAVIHPLSTTFKLKHAVLGCYLASTGLQYPTWGARQGEVVCKFSGNPLDTSTHWNVENHKNNKLTIDEYYVPPASNFFEDFIRVNFAMAASNNALVPDSDKYDKLASKWWQWPTLYLGMRMSGFTDDKLRYFLIGNVFNTWGSSLAVVSFAFLTLYYIIRLQRQTLDCDYVTFWNYTTKGLYPFLGWLLHFLPFCLMGRVTYVHHYPPALFFALFVLGYMIELTVGSSRNATKHTGYAISFGLLLFTFWYFREFHQGMSGSKDSYKHLKLLPTWNF